jgi:hypothetical protein
MQTVSEDSAECHIETLTVARAYSRRTDFALARLMLFDAPVANANRVVFHDDTLRIGTGAIRYHVNLVSADGQMREVILSHDEPVYFYAPRFMPLTHDEWKAGPPPEKLALMRCLLTSKTLFQWTGRWVEQRVTEIEHEVANGLLEPELRSELENLAAIETIVLPTKTRSCSV